LGSRGVGRHGAGTLAAEVRRVNDTVPVREGLKAWEIGVWAKGMHV
jgi:hypothetical protein